MVVVWIKGHELIKELIFRQYEEGMQRENTQNSVFVETFFFCCSQDHYHKTTKTRTEQDLVTSCAFRHKHT